MFCLRYFFLWACLVILNQVFAEGFKPGVSSISRLETTDAEAQLLFSSSNLPIIFINTNGQDISDDPKITAHMGIIYNGAGQRNNLTDPYNDYHGEIGIELRGNMTKLFDKKPYTFETRDSEGNNLNVSLLGLPKENDWVLAASYLDKTFIRDPLAYYMSRLMGNWASRTVHCELFLNDIYQGIYILQEQIKPDKSRLDITKMGPEDNSGEAVTGGYIYEVAQAGADFGERRRFKYPKSKDITTVQKKYIKEYDDGFRETMANERFADAEEGYAAWIEVDSFVDEILLQEACKNSDAYGWSSYFHKDRSAKLKAGPAWDFDQALSNSTFNNGHKHDEWVILSPDHNTLAAANHPFFWKKLFEEENFRNKLSSRWKQLRSSVFKTELLFEYVDSLAAVLNEAQERNFETWKILGKSLERSTPGVGQRDTYQKEVDYLKDFIHNRLTWMDEQLYNEMITGIDKENPSYNLKNFSNPFSDHTYITYSLPEGNNVTLEVFNIDGSSFQILVNEFQPAKIYTVKFDAQHLSDGVYFYKLRVGNTYTKTNKMIIRR